MCVCVCVCELNLPPHFRRSAINLTLQKVRVDMYKIYIYIYRCKYVCICAPLPPWIKFFMRMCVCPLCI